MDAERKFLGFIAPALNEESRRRSQTQPERLFPSAGCYFSKKRRRRTSSKVSRFPPIDISKSFLEGCKDESPGLISFIAFGAMEEKLFPFAGDSCDCVFLCCRGIILM